MSVLLQLQALVGPSIISWLLVRAFDEDRTRAAAMEQAGIAIALAIGVTSATFFGWRLMGLAPRSYWICDIAVQAVVFAAWYGRQRSGRPVRVADVNATAPQPGGLQLWCGAIAVAAVGVGAGVLWRTLAEQPYGWWDGWAIWNLRAAFLAVPDQHWRDGFTTVLGWSHPDYPLLIPASVARLRTFGENAATFGPRMLAAAFVVSSGLVLAGNVARRAGTAAMCLALSLMLIPTYLFWGASQTADVPLGTYMLIAVTALSVEARARYVLSGLATGFALWTKNEGVVVAAAVVIVLALLAWRKGSLRLMGDFALGLIFGGLTLLTFKLVVAPPSDLLHQIVTQQPLAKAIDLNRHGFVASYMAREFAAWGGLPVIPASLLVGATVIFSARRWQANRRALTVGCGVVGIVLCGYYWVYVLSPYDLQFHLTTSWSRLIAQLWPTATWTAVAAWDGTQSRARSHHERAARAYSHRPFHRTGSG